jgi:hypothetical protein
MLQTRGDGLWVTFKGLVYERHSNIVKSPVAKFEKSRAIV